MSKTISIVLIVLAAFSILVAGVLLNPKYAYPVRNNIDQTDTYVKWDLYCYREYMRGYTTKTYIGTYKIYGTDQVGTRVEYTNCSE